MTENLKGTSSSERNVRIPEASQKSEDGWGSTAKKVGWFVGSIVVNHLVNIAVTKLTGAVVNTGAEVYNSIPENKTPVNFGKKLIDEYREQNSVSGKLIDAYKNQK